MRWEYTGEATECWKYVLLIVLKGRFFLVRLGYTFLNAESTCGVPSAIMHVCVSESQNSLGPRELE